MKKQLQTGHAYTLVSITWKNTSHRQEIFITGHNPRIATYFYREAGNGKINNLTQGDLDGMLVFDGHDIPFTLDTETKRYEANERFNFVTEDPITLKAFILQYCLNPSQDTLRKILYHPPTDLQVGDKTGALLFQAGR